MRERLEADDVDAIVRADHLVVVGIGDHECEYAALLQVHLVDMGKRWANERVMTVIPLRRHQSGARHRTRQ